MSTPDDPLQRMWSRIQKLTGLYTQFVVLALAARGKNDWFLLHCSVVLCGDYLPRAPSAPVPEEEFLLLQTAYPISVLQTFVADVETKHRMRIGEHDIAIAQTGTDRHFWVVLDDTRRDVKWLDYRGPSTIIKYVTEFPSSLLPLLRFDPESVLRSYHRHPYQGLHDFGVATLGVSLGWSQNVAVEIIVPTWTYIKSLSVEEALLEISFESHEQIAHQISVYADVEPSNGPLVRLQILPVSEVASDDQGSAGMHLYKHTYGIANWEALAPDMQYKLSVTLAHSSGILLDSDRTLIARTARTDTEPNKVSREHFELAVALSTRSIPEKDGRLHPKVGAVVVKNGQVVTSAFRGEMGRGDHAEYIALERKARGNPDVEGADLVTTLEPCTTRSHDKRPCTSWIKSRRIRKVWIGTLDYNPAVAGLGELELQKDGIRIGRLPDDLTERVLRDNRDFLEEIEKKQPVISQEDQKHERDLIIETLRDSIHQMTGARDKILDYALKIGTKKLDRAVKDDTKQITRLATALDRAIVIQANDAGSWIRLAGSLVEIPYHSLALLAYTIATRIDATIEHAWIGLAKSELQDGMDDAAWPYVSSTEPADKSPHRLRSSAWVKLAELEMDPLNKLRVIYRALQLGNRSETLWNALTGSFLQDTSETETQSHADTWAKLALLCEEIGEEPYADVCFTKAQLIIYGSGPDAVKRTDQPARVIHVLSDFRRELAKLRNFGDSQLDAAIRTRTSRPATESANPSDSDSSLV